MSDEVDAAQRALERARDMGQSPLRNIRVNDAQQALYRAQKRQFEASIRRRAALAKPEGKP